MVENLERNRMQVPQEVGGVQMSELNVYHHELRPNEYAEFYLKYEADKTIAEKDKEIKELQKTNAQLASNAVMLNRLLDTREEEVKTLKTKLESVQASMYCDVVDANMENRRLKRALWLARAERAHKEVILFRDFSCLVGKEFKWRKIEKLCRAKAEEYK